MRSFKGYKMLRGHGREKTAIFNQAQAKAKIIVLVFDIGTVKGEVTFFIQFDETFMVP